MDEARLKFDGFAAPAGMSRSDLLSEAANSLDALMNKQGVGTESARSEAAEQLRKLMQDEARFADRPVVYAVTASEVANAAKQAVPIETAEYERSHNFYLVKFPFDLRPSNRWSFNQLQVEVDFYSGEREPRPKVHAIFPNSKLQEKLSATASLQVTLEPSLDFQAKTGALNLQAGAAAISGGAGISTGIKGGASLGIGPFGVKWKQALVRTSNTGLEWAWWEIGGTELQQGDDPSLMVILQVPRDSKMVRASGKLMTTRYINLISQVFKNLTHLSKVYRDFLMAGTPFPLNPVPVEWDLTEDLRRGN